MHCPNYERKQSDQSSVRMHLVSAHIPWYQTFPTAGKPVMSTIRTTVHWTAKLIRAFKKGRIYNPYLPDGKTFSGASCKPFILNAIYEGGCSRPPFIGDIDLFAKRHGMITQNTFVQQIMQPQGV